ncbi:MAG: carboxypeptidase-like regulatory domain-containing protein [Bacteroidales bacterium]|nr:carboxypeptidase-like regulatory domain-containing protein [Bacteroidales bacterium]
MSGIRILLFFLLSFFFANAFAQKSEENDLIQFSGVVVSADSLKPISFAHIIEKKTYRGTTSDFFGFFSFVVKKGDIIQFSSVGYKKSYYIVPDTLSGNRYSLIQMMQTDTILLTETVIYPWPTPEQFKRVFMNTHPPADDYDRAMRNLAIASGNEKGYELPPTPSMSYKNQINNVTNRLYYAGQLPPNNLLNPIAWSQFIKAWKNGEFRRKDVNSNEYYYNETLE